jgi:hypothetical protein
MAALLEARSRFGVAAGLALAVAVAGPPVAADTPLEPRPSGSGHPDAHRVAADSVPRPPGSGHLDAYRVAAKPKRKRSSAPQKKAGKVHAVAQRKAPPPPPPLDGTSFDYEYDGKAEGHPERRWFGRAFVHRQAAALAGQALPVLVFIHGNNAEKIKFRWMGGGQEGDVRRIISEMIEAGQVPPMLVAAPSSIDPNTMGAAAATWPAFDLDLFLDRTIERLGGAANVDRGRVLVAAHSGGGCNMRGGLASAMRAKGTPILAGLAIDTCLFFDLAKDLAHASPSTHVVVSYQTISWPEREFVGFTNFFKKEVKKAPPAQPGVLREVFYQEQVVAGIHDAMVPITLRKYLPQILGPGTPPTAAGSPTAAAP